MKTEIIEIMENCPVICAVKDDSGLKKALSSDINIIFILYGSVCSIQTIVDEVVNSGKIAMVHIDLITGLSSKEVAVDFIKGSTKAQGIISTKVNIIKRANELELYTVLRLFLIDSLSFVNVEKQYLSCKADFVEILPGVMPKIITKICENKNINVIAGGLIYDKEDVMSALNAGAISISTTCEDVWFL